MEQAYLVSEIGQRHEDRLPIAILLDDECLHEKIEILMGERERVPMSIKDIGLHLTEDTERLEYDKNARVFTCNDLEMTYVVEKIFTV